MGRLAGAVMAAFMLVACAEEGVRDDSSSADEGDTPAVNEQSSTKSGSNQPLTVVVDPSATQVRTGEVVMFRVTATDPDAMVKPPGTCRTFHWFGDEEARPAGCTPACAAQDHYDEIPPTRGQLTESFSHAYESTGTFEATFNYGSDRPCHQGFAYGSEGKATVTITVLP